MSSGAEMAASASGADRADAASLTVAVIAKECLPGRVKTRLTPPYSPEQAARIAAASLDDTLATVTQLAVGRLVLYFSGDVVPMAASGFRLLPQIGGALDARLAHLFDVVDGPLLLVGMDTPQFAERHVAAALRAWRDDIDAWLGLAEDGGFWALAMREPRGDVIAGVPMSQENTGAEQLRRLREAGLRVAPLPILTDVDTAESAATVAAEVPDSRFARVLAEVDRELAERRHPATAGGRA